MVDNETLKQQIKMYDKRLVAIDKRAALLQAKKAKLERGI